MKREELQRQHKHHRRIHLHLHPKKIDDKWTEDAFSLSVFLCFSPRFFFIRVSQTKKKICSGH
jgi:hypothetical protein